MNSLVTSLLIAGTIMNAHDSSVVDDAVVTLKQSTAILVDTTDAQGKFSIEIANADIDTAQNDSNLQSLRCCATSISENNAYSYKVFDISGRRIVAARKTKNANRYVLLRESGMAIYAGGRHSFLAKSSATEDSLIVEKSGYFTKRISMPEKSENLSIYIDTIPAAAILKRGAGGSSQSVAQNEAITAFSFALENCDSAYIEGVPEGISATFDASAKTISFSGIVTAPPDVYTYMITTAGGFTTATRSGKFTVTEAVAKPVKFEADGYAGLNGGTTGGSGGDTVEVSTYAAFKAAVQSTDPKVVVVKGTVKTTDGDGYGLKIASDKTIMGKDSSATIYGGIAISNVHNVIVYNININGTYPNPGPSDGIAVNGGSTNVWIHHVNIWDAEDGNLDITGQANFVTVSYVKFWYTDKNHPHRLNALIGSGASDHPEDFHKLKVTYHHNWFSTLVNERMPRVMYGNAHIYNNYYAPNENTTETNLYCIGVGSYASALIENNYFKNAKNPIYFMYDVYAYIKQSGNKFDGTSGAKDGTSAGIKLGERYITTDPYTLLQDPDVLDKAPYEYTLIDAGKVPAVIMKEAGPHNL